MANVKVLPKEISELIAAGEVIDRPSAIIKELLENSIDSGANIITIEIKNGGRTYMRITDNGTGIENADVPVAFYRHATSKISNASDLMSISSLGFRGEALASICAVSKVEVLTKTLEDEYGTHYVIEGGIEISNERSGCPDGTTIIVRDIFFNVPARLKFLKKDVTEGNAIAGIVSKIALSNSSISFKLIRDNKTELITAGDGKLFSTIYSVFGKEFSKTLIPIDYSINGISINGFISKPLESKAKRSFQNFFINKRYIKSVTCMMAIEEAYKNQIMTGKFPSCVLFINMPADLVDVNVHPAKLEVKFSNEKLIYQSIFFAVKNALMNDESPKELDIGQKTNFSYKDLHYSNNDENSEQTVISGINETKSASNSQVIKTYKPNTANLHVSSSKKEYLPESNNSNNQPIEEKVDIFTLKPNKPKVSEVDTEKYKFINTESLKKKEKLEEEKKEQAEEIKPEVRVIGEIFSTYILVERGDDFYMFDKHAAHERYIFENIKANVGDLDSQTLLSPVDVLLSYEEYDALIDNIDNAKKIGFIISGSNEPNITVKGIPVIADGLNIDDLISELANNFLANKNDASNDLFDELFHSLACKAAIKGNQKSDILELKKLIEEILDKDNIKYCPHGRPVFIKLSKKDIEKQFKRIV